MKKKGKTGLHNPGLSKPMGLPKRSGKVLKSFPEGTNHGKSISKPPRNSCGSKSK